MATYTTHSPSPVDNTTCFATSNYPNYDPFYPLQASPLKDWYSQTAPNTANQKFCVNFGSSFCLRRLLLINSHSFDTGRGIYHFAVYGSNSAAAVNNIGDYADETDLVLLASGLVAAVYTTGLEEEFLIDNEVEYQYYLLKIADNHGGNLLGIRQLTFQSEDGFVPGGGGDDTPGKPVTLFPAFPTPNRAAKIKPIFHGGFTRGY